MAWYFIIGALAAETITLVLYSAMKKRDKTTEDAQKNEQDPGHKEGE